MHPLLIYILGIGTVHARVWANVSIVQLGQGEWSICLGHQLQEGTRITPGVLTLCCRYPCPAIGAEQGRAVQHQAHTSRVQVEQAEWGPHTPLPLGTFAQSRHSPVPNIHVTGGRKGEGRTGYLREAPKEPSHGAAAARAEPLLL